MKSLEELKAIRDRVQNQMDMRNDNDNYTRIVIVWQPAESQQEPDRC